MQEKFMEQRQKLLTDTDRDQPTTDEEDAILSPLWIHQSMANDMDLAIKW